jgi:P27 family predicted phage terminase small subunit
MAGPRQPIDLVIHKGKKNLTKEEIERRRAEEVVAPNDAICPPKYLKTKAQKSKFHKIAGTLKEIGIMTNLDCDALARYIMSEEKYLAYDKMVSQLLREAKDWERAAGLVVLIEKFEGLRDKALKQCRAAASDLGLTISSRCKLVVPKVEKKEDPYSGMFGDEASG